MSDFLLGYLPALFYSAVACWGYDQEHAQNTEGLYIQDSLPGNQPGHSESRHSMGLFRSDSRRQRSAYHLRSIATVGLVREILSTQGLQQFRPRASVAWDVFGKGKTVVRAGVGVFFDDFSQDSLLVRFTENSFNTGPAYNAIGSAPVPTKPPSDPTPIAPGVPVFVRDVTADASTIQRNLRTPYVYNYNLNVQQEIIRGTVLQVGYVGSAGRKLLRLRDINQPTQAQITAADLGCNCINDGDVPRTAFTTPMSPLEPFAPFYLNQLESTATSNYNSLQVSLTQRNWHGFTHQISYTWSHSIDDASDSQDYVPNAAMPNDSTNPKGDKGPSNFDVRHRFVWASNYEFPKWERIGRMRRRLVCQWRTDPDERPPLQHELQLH